MVECNNRGIVWGIGYDHTAWVYTGGYGGGFIQGTEIGLLWCARFLSSRLGQLFTLFQLSVL